MKEKPIIFSGDMVRAILEGRKTQTRRVVKPQPKPRNEYNEWIFYRSSEKPPLMGPVTSRQILELCPYGKIGERLWVRESFCVYIPLKKSLNVHTAGGQKQVIYKASHKLQDMEGFEDIVLEQDIKWSSPIHMPRWASRITLKITDIGVERVQEIDIEGIHEEGVLFNKRVNLEDYRGDLGVLKQDFGNYWNSIHKKEHRWEDNSWVWVISFRRVK